MVLIMLDNMRKYEIYRFRPLAGIMVLIFSQCVEQGDDDTSGFRPLAGIMVLI